MTFMPYCCYTDSKISGYEHHSTYELDPEPDKKWPDIWPTKSGSRTRYLVHHYSTVHTYMVNNTTFMFV